MENNKFSFGNKILDKNKLSFLIIDPEEDGEHIRKILKAPCSKKNCLGIYVVLQIPSKEIIKSLKNNGIDASCLFFIDCISNISGRTEQLENCVFTSGPSALTELSIAINDQLNTNRFKFFVFDSLTTLLIYNNKDTILRFMHFLTSKLRRYNLKIVIFSLNDEVSKEIIRKVCSMDDAIINYNGKTMK